MLILAGCGNLKNDDGYQYTRKDGVQCFAHAIEGMARDPLSAPQYFNLKRLTQKVNWLNQTDKPLTEADVEAGLIKFIRLQHKQDGLPRWLPTNLIQVTGFVQGKDGTYAMAVYLPDQIKREVEFTADEQGCKLVDILKLASTEETGLSSYVSGATFEFDDYDELLIE